MHDVPKKFLKEDSLNRVVSIYVHFLVETLKNERKMRGIRCGIFKHSFIFVIVLFYFEFYTE